MINAHDAVDRSVNVPSTRPDNRTASQPPSSTSRTTPTLRPCLFRTGYPLVVILASPFAPHTRRVGRSRPS
jgi:hypothetical protein